MSWSCVGQSNRAVHQQYNAYYNTYHIPLQVLQSTSNIPTMPKIVPTRSLSSSTSFSFVSSAIHPVQICYPHPLTSSPSFQCRHCSTCRTYRSSAQTNSPAMSICVNSVQNLSLGWHTAQRTARQLSERCHSFVQKGGRIVWLD